MLKGSYYYGTGTPGPVALTPSGMHVWGSRPIDDDSDSTACMYTVTPADALVPGPCMTGFGEGEGAEAMAFSDDGGMAVLTAGKQLRVLQRASVDWTTWTTVYSVNASNMVFDTATLSGDGTLLAYGCEAGVCIARFNGTAFQQTASYSSGLNLDLGMLQFGGGRGTAAEAALLAATYNDNENGEQFAVAALGVSSAGAKTLLWLYRSRVSNGQLIDTTAALAVSQGGEAVVVGSWGDAQGVNPQVHVFQGWAATTPGQPVTAFATKGSVMAVTVAVDTSGTVASGGNTTAHVGVAGIAQHENLGVKGGFVLAADVVLPQ